MIKRIEERLSKNLLAYSEEGDYNLLGVIGNVSKNGIFIQSEKFQKPENEISFVLAIYNEIYRLKGVIKWVSYPHEIEQTGEPGGFGVRITEAPAEYLNFVEYIKYEARAVNRSSH